MIPLVTIVMCSYNEDILLKEAIESALKQDYPNFELLISDDASPNPKTHEVLQVYVGHPSVRILFNTENRGYLKNKNFAISHAKGEYITQLDNDDLIAADKISRQMEIIRQHPEMKIVSCGYYYITSKGELSRPGNATRDTVLQFPTKEFPFWFPSLLFHKSVLQTEGYFNEYFDGTMGDDYYWAFVANRKYPIYHIAAPLYYYRYNPNSITNVLNNERKIIVPLVLQKLLQQQQRDGEDWLQTKQVARIEQYEYELRNNRLLMSEQYRIWAAKAVDKNDWQMARRLMLKSFGKKKFNPRLLRTLVYYMKKKWTT
jgi:glycosyltransferase involved in cell wall biosynthesis